MVERKSGPLECSAVRIGRTDVGPATAVVDDETLTLVVPVEGEDRPVRLKLSAIDSVHRAGDELELMVRDGTRVTIASSSAAALEVEIVGRCRTLPELTRTLRAFGSSRRRRSIRETNGAEQQRFFAPLIDARRTAVHAAGADAIAAFDCPALVAAYEETLRRFAADRHAEVGPARRALEAELVDLSEPLYHALEILADAGSAAATSADDLHLWRHWAAQLRATFETADRVWIALDAALDAVPWQPVNRR